MMYKVNNIFLILRGFLIAAVITMTACVGSPPIDSYNYASMALNMANKAGARKHSPGLLDQASESYKQAEEFYKSKNYQQAEELFNKSKKLSEKAEMKSRLKRLKLGESF